MVKHMKEHLIGKTVSDAEHLYSEDVYGEVQTGMKFTFTDGTTITITIEHDDELNDRANLDWHIKHGEENPSSNGREFRKKPVVVEALNWQPNEKRVVEMDKFMGRPCDVIDSQLVIDTLEGRMLASPGDWVIKGIKGEFYPCKPDIFEQTYERAD